MCALVSHRRRGPLTAPHPHCPAPRGAPPDSQLCPHPVGSLPTLPAPHPASAPFFPTVRMGCPAGTEGPLGCGCCSGDSFVDAVWPGPSGPPSTCLGSPFKLAFHRQLPQYYPPPPRSGIVGQPVLAHLPQAHSLALCPTCTCTRCGPLPCPQKPSLFPGSGPRPRAHSPSRSPGKNRGNCLPGYENKVPWPWWWEGAEQPCTKPSGFQSWEPGPGCGRTPPALEGRSLGS